MGEAEEGGLASESPWSHRCVKIEIVLYFFAEIAEPKVCVGVTKVYLFLIRPCDRSTSNY